MLLIVFWAIFFFHEQTYIGAVNHFGKKKKKNKIVVSLSQRRIITRLIRKLCIYIVCFHMTSLKFKLKNYRSNRDFTFTMH